MAAASHNPDLGAGRHLPARSAIHARALEVLDLMGLAERFVDRAATDSGV
jgi:hypothetical protein